MGRSMMDEYAPADAKLLVSPNGHEIIVGPMRGRDADRRRRSPARAATRVARAFARTRRCTGGSARRRGRRSMRQIPGERDDRRQHDDGDHAAEATPAPRRGRHCVRTRAWR